MALPHNIEAAREDPRVLVDSLYAWRNVKESYLAAATSRLGEQLASSGLTEQRDVLLQHVNEFVGHVFMLTEPNVRVNGKNLEDVVEDEEDTEPFDEALDRHIWSLADQRMKWQSEIANKRRLIPSQVSQLMSDLSERQRSVYAQAGFAEEPQDADSEPEVQNEGSSLLCYRS
ncbi:hypothetical protein PUNSTDRAFT_69918 [Punctularia strigosozonata HHB-11173 SS5]|uniref:uncharacterized protein n=1 Tax=Punctularia strigosozonata (strain HHB-11173) TaxID=741275 RepID=UPI0004417797|nr:uncharacterized protein PUNSTDRAFT_69918 [Punctularia strigosozonata HHB-11173 SS5]EIN07591.1 hypothetical protein PUNSTDRAFT_69918 [Punctularia strigosozonata HHB-11173 SS5]